MRWTGKRSKCSRKGDGDSVFASEASVLGGIGDVGADHRSFQETWILPSFFF